ncbi:MAG TPA: hypothetical protein VF337_03735, partial [Candidatus Limnocylindrales bacterium]
MFENSPLVDLAIGRSTVRQRLLSLLMDESCGRLHLRELQRRADTSPGTASRELAKLVAAGLIEREAEGSQVYFKASASPFATMLRTVLVAMPAPEFKPRPARLPRIKALPATAEKVKSEAAESAVEPAMPEPAALESPEPPKSLAAEAELAVVTEAAPVALAPRIIEPIAATAEPAEPPTTIALAVSEAASRARAATADLVGLRVAGQLAD